MTLDDSSILCRLGSGEAIDVVCGENGMTGPKFTQWWRKQLKSRLPALQSALKLDGVGKIEILRDDLGTPHIYADTDDDLFFGYGYAMGQDRLWITADTWGRGSTRDRTRHGLAFLLIIHR